MFPPVESPCPLKSIQFPENGNFNCSVCKREVHDLSAMDAEGRATFLRECSGEVCVSYKVKRGVNQLKRSAIAGLFLVSATGLALPAAAQVGAALAEDMDEILVGGIKLPPHVEKTQSTQQQSSDDKKLQLIPVVEEDESEDTSTSAKPKN